MGEFGYFEPPQAVIPVQGIPLVPHPPDPNLINPSSFVCSIDESLNLFVITTKFSSGEVKSGSIPLSPV